MTLTNLAKMNPDCVRRLLNNSFYQLGAKYAALYPVNKIIYISFVVFCYLLILSLDIRTNSFFMLIEKTFFEPLGINLTNYFSYNASFGKNFKYSF